MSHLAICLGSWCLALQFENAYWHISITPHSGGFLAVHCGRTVPRSAVLQFNLNLKLHLSSPCRPDRTCGTARFTALMLRTSHHSLRGLQGPCSGSLFSCDTYSSLPNPFSSCHKHCLVWSYIPGLPILWGQSLGFGYMAPASRCSNISGIPPCFCQKFPSIQNKHYFLFPHGQYADHFHAWPISNLLGW